MNTLTTLAKKLIVTAQEINGNTYQFPVWEFTTNGAILVPGEQSNDWFFNSRDTIEPLGCAIEETEETQTFDKERLRESVEGAEREFGFGYDAGKIKELL